MINKRDVTFRDVLYVLKNGYREPAKDSMDEISQNWKYAIKGKTLDGIDIRVIIAISDQNMIIITVINKDIKD